MRKRLVRYWRLLIDLIGRPIVGLPLVAIGVLGGITEGITRSGWQPLETVNERINLSAVPVLHWWVWVIVGLAAFIGLMFRYMAIRVFELEDALAPPDSILELSEAISYPLEKANVYPGTMGSVVDVQLWRVSLKVTKPSGQADNVRVEIAEATPRITSLPVLAHEMHRTDGREARSLRFGDSPLLFDIISKEIGQGRLFLYRNSDRYQRNSFDGPDLLSDGESAAWWAKWRQQDRTTLRITAVPDVPAKEVTEIYELWLDDAGTLQMRKK